MPSSRSKRNGAPRKRRAARRSVLTEVVPFSVGLGKTANCTVGMLTRAPGRLFRPVSLRLEATAAYIPIISNGDSASGYAPAGVQLQMLDPTGHEVAASQVTLLGVNPRRVFVRYPRSGDWFEKDVPVNSVVFKVSAICLGPVGGNRDARVNGFAHLAVEYSPEIDPPACPTLLTEGDSDPDGYVTCVSE